MRIVVDRDRCEGLGMCEAMAHEFFELDDDDVLHILVPEPPEDRWEAMREAATRCPKQAIRVEE